MQCAALVTALNVLIGFIGVLFLALAYAEYTRLKSLRDELGTFKDQWHQEQARMQKAQQRVMASYQIRDIDKRIVLLRSAIAEDPKTFNGYNALGYAYLEKEDYDAARDALMNSALPWKRRPTPSRPRSTGIG